jgi:hypothetical protein
MQYALQQLISGKWISSWFPCNALFQKLLLFPAIGIRKRNLKDLLCRKIKTELVPVTLFQGNQKYAWSQSSSNWVWFLIVVLGRWLGLEQEEYVGKCEKSSWRPKPDRCQLHEHKTERTVTDTRLPPNAVRQSHRSQFLAARVASVRTLFWFYVHRTNSARVHLSVTSIRCSVHSHLLKDSRPTFIALCSVLSHTKLKFFYVLLWLMRKVTHCCLTKKLDPAWQLHDFNSTCLEFLLAVSGLDEISCGFRFVLLNDDLRKFWFSLFHMRPKSATVCASLSILGALGYLIIS